MPEYTESLVAFYDILGFSEYVRSHPSADDIATLFTQVKGVAEVDSDFTEAVGQRFIHFSDTVIRTTPFVDSGGRGNRFGILFHELLRAVHFQMELIWKELVWLRGAITFGQVYHSASEVYGPAVIRAYELERDAALFPRVIIDPLLLRLFEESSVLHAEHHTVETEREYCLNLICQGDDGVWFVDYLRAADQEADEAEYYPVFLARHKNMILRGLSKQTGLSRLSHKFIWLVRYHNKTIAALSDEYCDELAIDKSELLISAQDTSLYYEAP